MVELKENQLIFRFPEVHEHAICRINFQRTLRIPDDNREYSLPPGLGRFHLAHVEDYKDNLPETMSKRGGVMLPMYQSEAMWINFSAGTHQYPFAIKIAAGKINAVTGENWNESLHEGTQDYVVLPEQPWLDGFCVQKGLIRQFVAMPLGEGYTAEEQVTDKAEYGGLQIMAIPMKRSLYEELLKQKEEQAELNMMLFSRNDIVCEQEYSMGYAPGGLMRQQIVEDEHGADAWDIENASGCFVHAMNSEQWSNITGQDTPGKPPSARDYTAAGLPWFEYYSDKHTAIEGSKILSQLDSLAAKMFKKGKGQLPDNEPIPAQKVIDRKMKKNNVKDGSW